MGLIFRIQTLLKGHLRNQCLDLKEDWLPEKQTKHMSSWISAERCLLLVALCFHPSVVYLPASLAWPPAEVLTCPWCWAWFTRFVPGFAHVVCAAAHPLCHIKRQLILTSGSVIAPVAEAFSHVYIEKNKNANPSCQPKQLMINPIHLETLKFLD